MSQLKQMIQGAPVHERKIEIRTYPAGPQQIIVEGWLKDDRRVGGFHWDGRPRPPGVVHRLGIRLLVGGWPLTIQEAEAEMVEIPHELCRTLEESLKKTIGLTIASGFTDQVRRLLGGLEGCSHLTHLLLAMAPAILHGYWTQHSRKPRPVAQVDGRGPGSVHPGQQLPALEGKRPADPTGPGDDRPVKSAIAGIILTMEI